MGLLSLVKPSFLLFPLPLAFGCFLIEKKNYLFKCLILIIGLFVMVGPWIVRNWIVTKTFIPISTAGIFNFWTGNFPPAGGTTRLVSPQLYPQELVEALEIKEERPQNVAKINQLLFKSALGYIFENPLRTLRLFWWKLIRFWFDGGESLKPSLFANLSYNSLNLMLLILMLIGLSQDTHW